MNECHFEDYFYEGNDLGANYSKKNTIFKVWSPIAENIKTIVYKRYSDTIGQVYQMKKNLKGVWELVIEGDYKNYYYNYIVSIDGVEKETQDPYTKGATANGNKGMIVDFSSTNPKNWDNHYIPKPLKATESIVYEIHVKDFSVDMDSGMKNKGKYLALVEKDTKTSTGIATGLEHLKDLGITHLHLMPIYDFASVDETKENQYNWGYDPYLFNVLEGSYSTNPYDGVVRIREFKEMVKVLHENDIRVVMDVVYNHTYETGNSPFDIIVPKYYYRTDEAGEYSNGSGCGNEIASEKSMVRKFIIDSLKFWAKEYKLDGFRFDLMALYDIDTIKKIESELREINPNLILYGEPWTGGESGLEYDLQFKKGNQKGMNVALFNDDIRNAIKGDNDGVGVGFVSGGLNLEKQIKKGIVGTVEYNQNIVGFTKCAGESINYVSSHDNLTLYDKIEKSNPNISANDRVKMNKLALSIILTSQGVTFLQGGTEILRSKQGIHNSYNSGDEINKIEWDSKERNIDFYNYIKSLIDFKKSQKVLCLDSAEDIRRCVEFINSPRNTIAYNLKSHYEGDFRNLLIIHNPNMEEAIVELPTENNWTIIANEFEVNINGVNVGTKYACDNINVAPISTYILKY